MNDKRVEEVNFAMQGLSILLHFDMEASQDCSSYNLTLELGDKPRQPSRRTFVRFRNVSEMRIKDFGGGLTQLLLLKAQELGAFVIEGAKFEVKELERNSLSFKCESMEVGNETGTGAIKK